MRRVAWMLLWLGLAIAWGGARLVSGWVAGLRRIFTEEVTPASGPFYSLEVVTGSLFWLSPFVLATAGLLFFVCRPPNPNDPHQASLIRSVPLSKHPAASLKIVRPL